MVKIGVTIKDAKTGKVLSKEEHDKRVLDQKKKEAEEKKREEEND